MTRWEHFKSIFRPQANAGESYDLAIPVDSQNVGSIFNRFGVLRGRNEAIRYTPLARCVTLVASVTAGLITNGHLSIRGPDHRKVRDKRAMQVWELLTHSPNGGLNSSYNLIEDVATDYLLEGNGLLSFDYNQYGWPQNLRRYLPRSAQISPHSGDIGLYMMQEADDEGGDLQLISPRMVVHCRWGRLSDDGYSYYTWNRRFAPAPIDLLSSALTTGIETDKFIRDFLERGGKLFLNISHTQNWDNPLTKEQKEQIQTFHKGAVDSGKVYLSFDAKAESIVVNAYDKVPKDLRDDNMREIAQFYGLPIPLLSTSIEQWTKGINEQVMRLAVTTCFVPHIERILKPMALRLLQPGQYFHVDYSDLLRGDAVSLAQLITSLNGDAQRSPVATREEIRVLADLPPDPEGTFHPPMTMPDMGADNKSQ